MHQDELKRNQGQKNQTQMTKKLRETWSLLNDDDLHLYEKDRARFLKRIEEKYNVTRSAVEDKLKHLEHSSQHSRGKAA